jgi:hypothetical protein
VVNATPRSFYSREKDAVLFVQGLGGPHGQSGGAQKTSPPQEFDLLTVEPVESRCTECIGPYNIV